MLFVIDSLSSTDPSSHGSHSPHKHFILNHGVRKVVSQTFSQYSEFSFTLRNLCYSGHSNRWIKIGNYCEIWRKITCGTFTKAWQKIEIIVHVDSGVSKDSIVDFSKVTAVFCLRKGVEIIQLFLQMFDLHQLGINLVDILRCFTLLGSKLRTILST